MAEMKKISYSYKQIEDMANDFLDKINPKSKFPINDEIWNIAKDNYDIEIVYGNFEKVGDFIGSIVYDNRNKKDNIVQKRFQKNAVIMINDKYSERRQLFTIAHEFGHYFLMKDQFPNFGIADRPADGNMELNNEEYMANLFAGCVLMPMDKVVDCIGKKILFSNNEELSFEDIMLLKNKFGVSENVINARIDTIRKYYSLA